MLELPSEEDEYRFLSPLTLTSEDSRTFVTDSSTDSGPAFEYVVETETYGDSMSGKSPTDTFLSVYIPTKPRSAKTMSTRTGCSSVFLSGFDEI